ncbi:MAG: phosphonate transporter [Massilia sp.]|nr:phosphonate transporter [Massilia sp.]
MSEIFMIDFYQPDVADALNQSTDEQLDELTFGVIGFDRAGVVRRYNTFESKISGLAADKVLNAHLFTSVAPCMNNFMVAQRFDDALELAAHMDAVIDYVLTLRMRPKQVKLRLLSSPVEAMRFILVSRAQ